MIQQNPDQTTVDLPVFFLPKRIYLLFDEYFNITKDREKLDREAFKLAAKRRKISYGSAISYWQEGLEILNMYEDYFLANVDNTFVLHFHVKTPSYPWKKKLEIYKEFCAGVSVHSIAIGYKLSGTCVESFIRDVNKKKQRQ